jgi:hypothetical protein
LLSLVRKQAPLVPPPHSSHVVHSPRVVVVVRLPAPLPHSSERLRVLPERPRVHLVGLRHGGVWCVPPARPAVRQAGRAASSIPSPPPPQGPSFPCATASPCWSPSHLCGCLPFRKPFPCVPCQAAFCTSPRKQPNPVGDGPCSCVQQLGDTDQDLCQAWVCLG